MKNYQFVLDHLKNLNIPYVVHEVGTNDYSVDAHVKALGIKYAEGLSTLIYNVKNGEKYIAILRRDDRNINSKALRELLGTGNFAFASEEDMERLGLEVGLASPFLINDFPRPIPIKLYVDKYALEMNKVIVGSGDASHAVELQMNDLLPNIGPYEVIDVTIPNPKRDGDNLGNKNLRILSGITPSSSKGLHLGNYLGAVKPQIEFQEKGECLYFIADYHALNTVFDRETFKNNVYETYLDYLALGIDLEKTIFYVESHVPMIFELTEILSNCATLGEMKRMHGYKDKLANPDVDTESINMGMFTYPILMAADILLFEPDIIPVGEDQTQHVEITRDIAQSFNYRYGKTLKVPELYVKKGVARVRGTDGERKMSKSLGNDITIFADENEIKNQFLSIKTDPNRIHPTDPGDPAKNVIFDYMDLMDYDKDKTAEYKERYKKGTVGDVELKNEFYGFFLEYFAQERKKRNDLSKDKDKILSLMRENANKANVIAGQTMSKVRNAIGAVYV
jgi:tryptophanyl-tRNA synthetase